MINPISIGISTAISTALGVAKSSSKNTSTSTSKKKNTSSSKNNNSMTDKEFEDKYRKEIEGISKYNNVDLSVAKNMFATNLKSESGIYGGGGVAENWSEMITDYNKLQNNYDTKGRNTSTSTSNNSSINNMQYVSSKPTLLNDFVSDDTIGVIIGIGVLYMFLSIFKR